MTKISLQKFAIYGLRDASGIHYIGSTAHSERRPIEHWNTARTCPAALRNERLVKWLLALTQPLETVILTRASTKARALEIEEFLTIDLSDYFDLFNEFAGASPSVST